MSSCYQPRLKARSQKARQNWASAAHMQNRRLLIDLPIRWRLTIGFLAAALIASLAAGITGSHYIQSLNTQASFYQDLLQCTETLSTGNDYLQLMDTQIHQTLDDASVPNPSRETVNTNMAAVEGLMDRYNAILTAYTQQQLLAQHPDQVALLAQTGTTEQVSQQHTLLGSVLRTWQVYRAAQHSVLNDIKAGKLVNAQTTERLQAEPTQADALSSLRALIQFTRRLASSVNAASNTEVRDLWLITLLTATIAFFSTTIVGLLISKSLVERLHQLRHVTQAIEKGLAIAHVTVIGHDEIAAVSTSVNSLLDTVAAKKQIAAAYEQQRQLNQLKDQFILNVSHELRTPLTEIYGYLELLKQHQGEIDPPLQARFIDNAMGGCDELILLVNSILDATSAGKEVADPHAEEIAVTSLVHDVLAQLDPQEKQDHPLQVDISEHLTAWADRHYVRRILRNLLSNAFKYSPKEAPITIQAAQYTPAGHETADQHWIYISVKDSGPGIPSTELPLLFQKFMRLKRDLSGPVRGTGLGLYISKQLVESMHGRIWVESSGVPGEGSCFCFTLPMLPLPIPLNSNLEKSV